MKLSKGWEAFEDIAQGRITDASFVANLWRVHIRDPNVDSRYKDPIEFFRRTYISEGLFYVLRNVVNRLAGKGGEPIILLKTTFGGGKTHTLIAIYHLLRRPDLIKRIERLRGALGGLNFVVHPAIVVFDGVELDPRRLLKTYGASNLWQFIFLQLAEVADSEVAKKVAYEYASPYEPPGAETISSVLRDLEDRNKAAVLLLDELPEFIKSLTIREERQAQAVYSFMAALARAFAFTKLSLLIIAIPDVPRYADENRIIEDMLRELRRVAMPKTIIGRGDAVQVLRQALLENVDLNESTVRANDYYNIYSQAGQEFPPIASTEAYRDKLATYYPFHPQYVEILYDKISTLEGFQSTRDVLRLTARVIHLMYKKELVGGFILLSDIDVTDASILDELLERHGYRNLRVAIEGDLEVIKRVDEENLRRRLPALAAPIYSALLAYSLSGEPASTKEIALGVVRPGVPPQLVARMLEYLYEEKTAHIHRVSAGAELRYIIRERANWRRLVELKSRDVENDVARELLRERLLDATRRWGRHVFEKIILWPSSPTEIEDNIRLKLVLLDPETSSTYMSRGELEKYLNFFACYADAARREYRRYRNTLVFLIPDIKTYDSGLRLAKRIIAAYRLKEAKEQYGLTSNDLQELERAITEWERALSQGIPAAMYSKVAYVVGGRLDGLIYEYESIRDKNPVERTKRVLYEVGKIVEKISAQYLMDLLSKMHQAGGTQITLDELTSVFAKDPEKPYLLNPLRQVSELVRELTAKDDLVVVKGDKVYCGEPVLPMGNDVILLREVAETKGILVKPRPSRPLEPETKLEEVPTKESTKLMVMEKPEHQAVARPRLLVIRSENIGLRELVDILQRESGKLRELSIRKEACLLYTSPSPRDLSTSRMPSSA